MTSLTTSWEETPPIRDATEWSTWCVVVRGGGGDGEWWCAVVVVVEVVTDSGSEQW